MFGNVGMRFTSCLKLSENETYQLRALSRGVIYIYIYISEVINEFDIK